MTADTGTLLQRLAAATRPCPQTRTSSGDVTLHTEFCSGNCHGSGTVPLVPGLRKEHDWGGEHITRAQWDELVEQGSNIYTWEQELLRIEKCCGGQGWVPLALEELPSAIFGLLQSLRADGWQVMYISNSTSQSWRIWKDAADDRTDWTYDDPTLPWSGFLSALAAALGLDATTGRPGYGKRAIQPFAWETVHPFAPYQDPEESSLVYCENCGMSEAKGKHAPARALEREG